MQSRPRLTVVSLLIALAVGATASAQDAPSTSTFNLRGPNFGRSRLGQPRPFDKYLQPPQAPKPKETSPATPALAPPTQDLRVPALIPYENGIARTPSIVCAARIIPMDQGVDPGALVRPLPKETPGKTKLPILGAEGTCAPNPRAAVAPK